MTSSPFRYLPQRNDNLCSYQNLYMNVCRSSIHVQSYVAITFSLEKVQVHTCKYGCMHTHMCTSTQTSWGEKLIQMYAILSRRFLLWINTPSYVPLSTLYPISLTSRSPHLGLTDLGGEKRTKTKTRKDGRIQKIPLKHQTIKGAFELIAWKRHQDQP